jgi:predicted methyltransferase
MRALQPDHDAVAPDIEAVISKRRPDMLQALTSGNFMVRIIHHRAIILGALASLAMLAASAAPAQDAKTPDYEAIIASPDRTDSDRQADQRRQPAKMLAFTEVKTGMKVLDMEASAGYSTELLARAVGPSGIVYAQDSAAVIERFVKDKFDIRAQKPVMKNVVHVVRDFDDPIPPDVTGLDLITFFFAYHDITYMEVDRAAMNKKMFAALKPGGFLIIADHSAKAGAGISVAKTLHRIEENTVRQEIEAAGFKLVAEGSFLRHPEDPRDTAVFRPQVPTDEFVLKYQKPL